ncbi:MAG: DUF4445 domain-containing protein [Candidatus Thorarchaeota archaeon]|nr:DUF4445 domain-containing protein [Candidatus Thorarchaeota archaeon]
MPGSNDYGIAVDIGTTNITFYLVRLNNNHIENRLLMRNPQSFFGADVISRIRHSLVSHQHKLELVESIREVVERGVEGLLEEVDVRPSRVSDVVIVGNTVMHHLFFDLSLDSLTRPPYQASDKKAIHIDASNIGLDILQKAECYSPPVVESFIGPDAIAVLIASNYLDERSNQIVIDVGTNTEISVITPKGIWIVSAASGPAFEGMAIDCGIGGEIGAINKVSVDSKTYRPMISVIGNSRPRGICGTGAVSAMASMLDANLLLPHGSLNRDLNSKWLSFDGSIARYILEFPDNTTTGSAIYLAQTDIRMLQQSKAAIRGAIEVVLMEANTKSSELTALFLTGVFGSDLQIEDAYRIGMFPHFKGIRIQQTPRGAVDGAAILLKSENRLLAESLVEELNYIELTENEDFKRMYLESFPFPNR